MGSRQQYLLRRYYGRVIIYNACYLMIATTYIIRNKIYSVIYALCTFMMYCAWEQETWSVRVLEKLHCLLLTSKYDSVRGCCPHGGDPKPSIQGSNPCSRYRVLKACPRKMVLWQPRRIFRVQVVLFGMKPPTDPAVMLTANSRRQGFRTSLK